MRPERTPRVRCTRRSDANARRSASRSGHRRTFRTAAALSKPSRSSAAGGPTAFPALDDALFDAHFVNGVDIGDPDVLLALVEQSGAPPSEVSAALEAGEGAASVMSSMDTAREVGIAATPAWLFGDSFVVPGVQPRELFERVVTRLRARTGDAPAGPGR